MAIWYRISLTCFELLKSPEAWGVEFSQKPGRHEVWRHKKYGTITTKCKVLIIPKRKFMCGPEFLLVQGWPREIIEKMCRKLGPKFRDSAYRFLAGNAFEAGAFIVVLLSVLIHWPKVTKETTGAGDIGSGEVDLDAMSSLFDFETSP